MITSDLIGSFSFLGEALRIAAAEVQRKRRID